MGITRLYQHMRGELKREGGCFCISRKEWESLDKELRKYLSDFVVDDDMIGGPYLHSVVLKGVPYEALKYQAFDIYLMPILPPNILDVRIEKTPHHERYIVVEYFDENSEIHTKKIRRCLSDSQEEVLFVVGKDNLAELINRKISCDEDILLQEELEYTTVREKLMKQELGILLQTKNDVLLTQEMIEKDFTWPSGEKLDLKDEIWYLLGPDHSTVIILYCPEKGQNKICYHQFYLFDKEDLENELYHLKLKYVIRPNSIKRLEEVKNESKNDRGIERSR